MGKHIWNPNRTQHKSKNNFYQQHHQQSLQQHNNLRNSTSPLDDNLIDSDQEFLLTHCPLERRGNQKSPQQHVDQRLAANLRERKRMQSINHAFEDLRGLVPTLPYEKRLSKVNTLRLAISYIGFMSELLDTTDQNKSLCRQNLATDKSNKVILHNNCFESDFDQFGVAPLFGHSLSWCTEKASIDSSDEISNVTTRSAKVWIPEDPRSS